jgi:lysophospholipase L1-like esterase
VWGFTKLTLSPLLVAQGLRTRRRALELPEAGGPREGVTGEAGADAPVLRLLIVGDSSAAGVGAPTQDQALAGQLSRELAQRTGQAVAWQLVARTGLTTHGALTWVQAEPPRPCDVVVVVLGVNDVLAQVPPVRAVGGREALWSLLRERCAPRLFVWTAAPPLEHFPLLPWPLRSVLGNDARQINRAQAQWAEPRGIVHLELPSELADGQLAVSEMADDGFHPAPVLYARWAAHLAALIVQRGAPTRTPAAAALHLPTTAWAQRR